MSERNLGVVNNVLGIEANGNPGDVITRDAGLGVGWAPPGGGIAGIAAQNAGVPLAGGPWQTVDAIAGVFADGGGGVLQYTPPGGGIAGIAAQNAGVPLAGGPWQTLDALTGVLADGGGGVLQYTPPAVPAAAWTTVSKPANQSVGVVGLTLDADLVTGALTAGIKYRVRGRIFWNNQSSNGGQGQFAVPGLTFYRENFWFQNFANGSIGAQGNVATAPALYSNGNTGDGVLEFDILITPSANGVLQWQFSGVAGGAGNLTVYAGSYLEYGIA